MDNLQKRSREIVDFGVFFNLTPWLTDLYTEEDGALYYRPFSFEQKLDLIRSDSPETLEPYTDFEGEVHLDEDDLESILWDLDLCDDGDEIFEYWAISEYLGRELSALGEAIFELNGSTVWGRTTTGQAIYMDGVIKKVAQGMLDD